MLHAASCPLLTKCEIMLFFTFRAFLAQIIIHFSLIFTWQVKVNLSQSQSIRVTSSWSESIQVNQSQSETITVKAVKPSWSELIPAAEAAGIHKYGSKLILHHCCNTIIQQFSQFKVTRLFSPNSGPLHVLIGHCPAKTWSCCFIPKWALGCLRQWPKVLDFEVCCLSQKTHCHARLSS